MKSDLDFFTHQGPLSSPGPYAHLLNDLPAEVPALRRLVQGITLHVFWAQRYGFEAPADRAAEVQLRSMRRRLGRLMELDASPLTEARPVEKRLIGNCRDFSLTLAMLLRRQGIPARARCGFGAYFTPGMFEDHWVCEVWDEAEGRWALVDAQLDDLQCEALNIPFNPLDVPRDQFITGGLAWQMCRTGKADPERFGIADMHGLWFIRGNVIRDAAALNRTELLPWDCWGLIESDEAGPSEENHRFLDEVATLTCGDVPEFDRLKELYEHDARLHVPPEIHSYTAGGMQVIQLEELKESQI